MASLSTINDDVIREIGMCLLNDKSSLCALGLTHRSLHMVIRKLIVRNIDVRVQESYDGGIERYNQLIYTLQSQPDLGANTRSLRIEWGWDTQWPDIEEDTANERANRLLSLTPAIHSLHIHNHSRKCGPFVPPLHLVLNLNLLQELTTLNHTSTVHQVTRLMQVPSLKILKVWLMDVWMTQSTTDWEAQPLATHLTQLTLAPQSHLSPSAVHSLLKMAPNIKSLSTNLTGLQSQEAPSRTHRPHDIRILESLSPAGILTCLRPVRETLEELDLHNVGGRWPGHDGSRLDLRAFECMKKISLPAACIFIPHGSWESRNGLGQLLRKTIEDIVIKFDYSHGFLYTATEIEADAPNALSWAAPERYSWLTELVADADFVPNLRHLTIKEPLESSQGVSFRAVWWEPPTILKAQFQSKGWEVEIQVRAPIISIISPVAQ